MAKPTNEQYIKAARRLFEEEGTLEIDDSPTVSRGDDPGAYVQYWCWVPDDEASQEFKRRRK